MKVQRLFIISILADDWTSLDDEEIFPGGEALYEKYLDRPMSPDRLALVQVDNRRDAEQIQYTKGNLRGPSNHPDTGVYIFAHGCAATVGGYDAAELAAFVKDELQIQSIAKLALVACNSAKVSTEASFLKDFCEALRKKELRPKVAGWDGYITVCSAKTDHGFIAPLTPQELALSVGGQKKWNKFEQGAIPPAYYGRKIAKGISGGHKDKHKLVDGGIRQARKHFWRIDEAGAVSITENGWTQRATT